MRPLILVLLICAVHSLQAQQVPRFAKYPIGDSGCEGYFPGDPEFEMTWSDDSSKVYTGEVALDSFNYFAICVKLSEPQSASQREQLDLLESYMDFLQEALEVTGSAGYGEGHTLEYYPSVSGVIDYWEDAGGNSYTVKGWTNTQYLVVLGIYGQGEYPYFNAGQMYLEGIRFPEE